MKLIKLTPIAMMSLLTVACGGGGGGGSSTPSSQTNTATPAPVVTAAVEETVDKVEVTVDDVIQVPVVSEPEVQAPVVDKESSVDPDAVYATTAELVAEKSFLLEQEYTLAVSFKNTENRPAYLSVCSDFSQQQASIKVNYNSCLLRSSITGDYNGSLNVANDKTRLVMAIWYLDDAKNPEYAVWEKTTDLNASQAFIVN